MNVLLNRHFENNQKGEGLLKLYNNFPSQNELTQPKHIFPLRILQLKLASCEHVISDK